MRASGWRSALADDPLVAMLLLIHDLHPVPLEDRVHRALEQVRPYMESHGGNVELLSLVRGRRPAAAGGQLLGLLGLCRHARAGDQAGARGGCARSGRAGGRGSHARPGAAGQRPRCPWRRPRRHGWRSDSLDLLIDGKMVAADVAGTELVVANVGGTLLAYRDAVRGLRQRAARRRAERRRAAAARSATRMYFLPRAGRSMDDRPSAARPGARCCATGAPSRWRWRRDRERRKRRRLGRCSPIPGSPRCGRRGGRGPPAQAGGLRPARPHPAGLDASADGAAGGLGDSRRRRRAVRHLRHHRAGRPSASAASGGAPDRVRVRELLGAALRRCGVPPGRQPDRVAARHRAARRRVGELPDPDRAGVLHGLDHRRLRGRPLPQPGRRHRERAALRILEPDGRAQPGAGGASSPTSRA